MSLKTSLLDVGTNVMHFVRDNASDILSVCAIVGVAATAIAAIKCKEAADEVIKEEEEKREKEGKTEELTTLDKVKLTWWCHIPTAVTFLATGGCILYARKIDKDEKTRMILAYNILKEGSDKFRKYAIEEIGKNKVKQIDHKMHQEELKKAGEPDEEKQMASDVATGGMLMYDRYSGQYIHTTYEKVYRAAERVNEKLRPYGKGGRDWYSHADFIVDCGGEYAEACEKWGYIAKPFGDVIDVNDILDPHIQEYKNHRCTVTYLNVFCDEKDFL